MPHEYPNTGIMFTEKKKTNKNAPDRTGTIDIGPDLLKEMLDVHNAGGDVVMRIAGWIKEGRQGPFLSLRVEMQQERRKAGGGGSGELKLESGPRRASGPQESFELDDEIPF